VEINKARRGKFSVPINFEDDSDNLNVERIIDTEQDTRDEPLLSSLT
jgi:hypothetical protein